MREDDKWRNSGSEAMSKAISSLRAGLVRRVLAAHRSAGRVARCVLHALLLRRRVLCVMSVAGARVLSRVANDGR